jgi:diketogulonate reductase-like aldo/keto reductase
MTMNERATSDFFLPPIGFGMWDSFAQIVKDSGGQRLPPDPVRDASQLSELQQAIALGYRHFDTAEMYAAGHSETILGRGLIGHKRSDFIITTKVNAENLAYDNLLAACDRSLERLQTDYIDLYLIHWPNPEIPLAESFDALNHLVQVGKIRHIGVSNFNVPLLEQAVALSETPLATNQVYYSLLSRRPQQDGTLEFCRKNDIVLTAYAPLRGGVLTLDATVEIAGRLKATPAQVALNWLVRQPGVVTIPHSGNEQRQRENLEAVSLELTEADIRRLDSPGN